MRHLAGGSYGGAPGRWRQRVGGGLATLAALALLVAGWWFADAWRPAVSARSEAPLKLVLVVPPKPPPPVPLPPTKRPEGGGGRHAMRRAPAPAPPRPAPARVAAGDPTAAAERPTAPPRIEIASDLPVPVLAPTADAWEAAVPGVGAEAGSGSGRGTGEGSAHGPGTGAGKDRMYTTADWVVMPSDAELRPFWPRRAVEAGRSGETTLACRVRLNTRVRQCRVLEERPAWFEFGNAALAASRIFQIRPPTVNGLPVDNAWVLVKTKWTWQSPPAKP